MRGTWAAIGAALGTVALAGTAAAESPLVAPPASWAVDFSVDAVYATRGGLDDNPLMLNLSNAPILSGSDFGFSWEPGADARFKVATGRVNFDARFLGGFDFTATESLTTPPFSSFPTIPSLFVVGGAAIDAVYSTQFNSAELNVGYDFARRFTGFVGARTVWVNDSLDIAAGFAGNSADVLWNVNTFGAGPQIGGAWQLVNQGELGGALGGLGVSLDGRFGYLWTSSDAEFSVTQNLGPGFNAAGSFTGGTIIAEGGVKVLLPLWRNLTVEAGYRVVYLDAVPNASGSVAATRVIDEKIDETSESLLVHGGTLGISAHF